MYPPVDVIYVFFLLSGRDESAVTPLSGLLAPSEKINNHKIIQKGGSSIKRAKTVKSGDSKLRPALSPEAKLNRMVSRAMDLLEERLNDGSASSQELTTVARYGFESRKLELELEKLQEENKLLKAKTEAIQSQKHVEELFQEAIKAMKDYSGHGDDYDEEDDEDDYYGD